jgi:adenine/guanine phosphoribosyltransferase-like PRPP-binding protein
MQSGDAGEVRRLDWAEFGRACDRLGSVFVTRGIDLVVGVVRGGLPLAVALAHRLHLRSFGVLHLSRTTSDSAFALDEATTMIHQGALLPPGPFRHVLLVEDVVANGVLVREAEHLLRARYGSDLEISVVTLFADLDRVAQGPAIDLAKRLVSDQVIDNRRVWITFPWEHDDRDTDN